MVKPCPAHVRPPLWRISLLCALMLSACGGGSPDQAPNQGQTDVPTAGAPASEAASSASPSPAASSSSGVSTGAGMGSTSASASSPLPPSRYTASVTLSRSSSGPMAPTAITTWARVLHVVDLRSGTTVRQYKLPQGFGPSDSNGQLGSDWLLTQRHHLSANRLQRTHMGAGQLFFIQDNQLMKLDLSGETLGEARPVSSAIACWIGEALATDDDASQAWLKVYAANSSAGCGAMLNHSYRLISSAAGPTDPAHYLENNKELIDTLYDDQGQMLGLLAVDRSTSAGGSLKLALWRPGQAWQQLQSLAPSSKVSLSYNPLVRRVSGLPTDARQSLLQIATSVYLLDWRSGGVSLRGPLLTLPVLDPALITMDSSHVYIADGCKVHKIDGEGSVTLMATLPADGGHIVQLRNTPAHIVAVQAPRAILTAAPGGNSPVPGHSCGNPSDTGARVRALHKATGAVRLLDSSANAYDFQLLATTGEQVLVDARRITPTQVKRLDATGQSAPEAIASKAQIVAGVAPAIVQGPGLDQSEGHLIWCETGVMADANCRGGKLVSHALGRRSSVVLGTLPAQPDVSFSTGLFNLGDVTPTGNGLWATQPGLLRVASSFLSPAGNAERETLWWLLPGGSLSLREISPAP